MTAVRRTAIIAAGCAAVLGLASCGASEPPDTPVACLAPSSAYLSALEVAPGQVRLDGTTPISACLVEEQPAGPLTEVGESMVAAATELNRQALRGEAAGQSATELGYLVGAAEQGASGTGGIHRDLVLRLESAARYGGASGDALPDGFQANYDRGYDAGHAAG
jgi:hypothetical protein